MHSLNMCLYKNSKYYTGIGSRSTPEDILVVMTGLAKILSSKGYILRSGGADGADTAFEQGANRKEIYLPWKGFNDNDSEFIVKPGIAYKLASKYHPNWEHLKDSIKKLHARNTHQVLGQDFKTWSRCVFCWTPDGCTNHKTRTSKTGGTGMAISIADIYGIPVYNLQREDHLYRVKEYIEAERPLAYG